MEFHNMQISDHRYLEEVFNKAPAIGIEALKTNVLIWGLFMSTTTKASIHLGPTYTGILEVYRNTNFEELQNLVLIGPSSWNSECDNDDWTAPSWARSALGHDQVIRWTKAKSTCLLRFRIMLCEHVRSFRSESIMGKSSRIISTVQFLQRVTWN